MHLISYEKRGISHKDYLNCLDFSRVDTLPYIFHKVRIHRNLTKAALAKKILFSQEYVQGVEDGSRFPSLKYCLACGDLFGFNPEWIKVKWLHAFMERVNKRVMSHLGLTD